MSAETNFLYDVSKGGCRCDVVQKTVTVKMNLKEATNHTGDVDCNASELKGCLARKNRVN